MEPRIGDSLRLIPIEKFDGSTDDEFVREISGRTYILKVSSGGKPLNPIVMSDNHTGLLNYAIDNAPYEPGRTVTITEIVTIDLE